MSLSFDKLPEAVCEIQDRMKVIEQFIFNLNNNRNTENAWLNIDELCDYLPDKPAKKTVYKWVSNNTIPHYKGTKALRFLKPEIDEWLKEGKVETAQEILEQINGSTALPLKRRARA
jgi:excisionase family DNA binding protein